MSKNTEQSQDGLFKIPKGLGAEKMLVFQPDFLQAIGVAVPLNILQNHLNSSTVDQNSTTKIDHKLKCKNGRNAAKKTQRNKKQNKMVQTFHKSPSGCNGEKNCEYSRHAAKVDEHLHVSNLNCEDEKIIQSDVTLHEMNPIVGKTNETSIWQTCNLLKESVLLSPSFAENVVLTVKENEIENESDLSKLCDFQENKSPWKCEIITNDNKTSHQGTDQLSPDSILLENKLQESNIFISSIQNFQAISERMQISSIVKEAPSDYPISKSNEFSKTTLLEHMSSDDSVKSVQINLKIDKKEENVGEYSNIKDDIGELNYSNEIPGKLSETANEVTNANQFRLPNGIDGTFKLPLSSTKLHANTNVNENKISILSEEVIKRAQIEKVPNDKNKRAATIEDNVVHIFDSKANDNCNITIMPENISEQLCVGGICVRSTDIGCSNVMECLPNKSTSCTKIDPKHFFIKSKTNLENDKYDIIHSQLIAVKPDKLHQSILQQCESKFPPEYVNNETSSQCSDGLYSASVTVKLPTPNQYSVTESQNMNLQLQLQKKECKQNCLNEKSVDVPSEQEEGIQYLNLNNEEFISDQCVNSVNHHNKESIPDTKILIKKDHLYPQNTAAETQTEFNYNKTEISHEYNLISDVVELVKKNLNTQYVANLNSEPILNLNEADAHYRNESILLKSHLNVQSEFASNKSINQINDPAKITLNGEITKHAFNTRPSYINKLGGNISENLHITDVHSKSGSLKELVNENNICANGNITGLCINKHDDTGPCDLNSSNTIYSTSEHGEENTTLIAKCLRKAIDRRSKSLNRYHKKKLTPYWKLEDNSPHNKANDSLGLSWPKGKNNVNLKTYSRLKNIVPNNNFDLILCCKEQAFSSNVSHKTNGIDCEIVSDTHTIDFPLNVDSQFGIEFEEIENDVTKIIHITDSDHNMNESLNEKDESLKELTRISNILMLTEEKKSEEFNHITETILIAEENVELFQNILPKEKTELFYSNFMSKDILPDEEKCSLLDISTGNGVDFSPLFSDEHSDHDCSFDNIDTALENIISENDIFMEECLLSSNDVKTSRKIPSLNNDTNSEYFCCNSLSPAIECKWLKTGFNIDAQNVCDALDKVCEEIINDVENNSRKEMNDRTYESDLNKNAVDTSFQNINKSKHSNEDKIISSDISVGMSTSNDIKVKEYGKYAPKNIVHLNVKTPNNTSVTTLRKENETSRDFRDNSKITISHIESECLDPLPNSTTELRFDSNNTKNSVSVDETVNNFNKHDLSMSATEIVAQKDATIIIEMEKKDLEPGQIPNMGQTFIPSKPETPRENASADTNDNIIDPDMSTMDVTVKFKDYSEKSNRKLIRKSKTHLRNKFGNSECYKSLSSNTTKIVCHINKHFKRVKHKIIKQKRVQQNKSAKLCSNSGISTHSKKNKNENMNITTQNIGSDMAANNQNVLFGGPNILTFKCESEIDDSKKNILKKSCKSSKRKVNGHKNYTETMKPASKCTRRNSTPLEMSRNVYEISTPFKCESASNDTKIIVSNEAHKTPKRNVGKEKYKNKQIKNPTDTVKTASKPTKRLSVKTPEVEFKICSPAITFKCESENEDSKNIASNVSGKPPKRKVDKGHENEQLKNHTESFKPASRFTANMSEVADNTSEAADKICTPDLTFKCENENDYSENTVSNENGKPPKRNVDNRHKNKQRKNPTEFVKPASKRTRRLSANTSEVADTICTPDYFNDVSLEITTQKRKECIYSLVTDAEDHLQNPTPAIKTEFDHNRETSIDHRNRVQSRRKTISLHTEEHLDGINDVLKCGVCLKNIKKYDWIPHCAKEHNPMGWIDGKTPLKHSTPQTNNKVASLDDSSAGNSKDSKDLQISEVTCAICNWEGKEENWIDHIFEEHEYLAWRNGDSTLDFQNEVVLQNHLKTLSNIIPKLKCKKCGAERKKVNDYIKHIKKCEGFQQKHNTPQRVNQVPSLDASSAGNSEDSKRHLQVSEVTCAICNWEGKEESWIDHIFEKHEYLAWRNGDATLDFENEVVLRKHFSTLLKILSKLKCKKCGAERKYVNNYIRHIKKCEGAQQELMSPVKLEIQENQNSSQKRNKRRRVSSESDNLCLKKLKEESEAEVRCGRCQEAVQGKNWNEHLIKHDYMTWKEGEDAIDMENSKSVNQHLRNLLDLCKVLICRLCEAQLTSISGYQVHMRRCEEKKLNDSMGKISKRYVRKSDIVLPTSQQPITNPVKCAVCSEQMPKKNWFNHLETVHYNLAWFEGGTPFDLMDYNTCYIILNDLYKKRNKLECVKCGVTRMSGAGFYAHIITCQKSTEEIEEMKVKCDLCERRYLPLYHATHMSQHRRGLIAAVDGNDAAPATLAAPAADDSPPATPGSTRRRRAAVAAKANIEKITTELVQSKQSCTGCGFEAYTTEEYSKHRCGAGSFETAPVSDDDSGPETRWDSESEESESDVNSELSAQETRSPSPLSSDGENCDSRPSHGGEKKKMEYDKAPYKPGQDNRFYTKKFYKDYAKELCDTHLTTETLFPEMGCQQFVRVPAAEAAPYMPPLSRSCNTALHHARSDHTTEWKSFDVFGSDIRSGLHTLFAGGPVAGLAWAPPADCASLAAGARHLAVSCQRDADLSGLAADTLHSHRGLIQIWSFDDFDKPVPARFVLGIAHEYGTVWALTWCPSGGRDERAGAPHRLGLLAAACSDGSVYIFAVCDPDQLPPSENPFYKTKPVMELRLCSDGSSRQSHQATAVYWSMQKGHSMLSVGYADGTVALYDLATDSPILRKTHPEHVTCLNPYYDSQIATSTINVLSVQPAGAAHEVDVDGWSVWAGVREERAGTAAAVLSMQRLGLSGALFPVQQHPALQSQCVDPVALYTQGGASYEEWVTQARRWLVGAPAAACPHSRRLALASSAGQLTLWRYTHHLRQIKKHILCTFDVKPLQTKKFAKAKAGDNLELKLEPFNYKEAVEQYGLVSSDRNKLKLEGVPADCYPLSSMTCVAFCPSARDFGRVACAGYAGLVYVHKL